MDPIRSRLVAVQGAEGGLPAVSAAPPDAESTALGGLALRDAAPDAAKRAREWLRARQRADGSWPLRDGLDEGSWATATVLLALGGAPEPDAQALRRGGEWLVRRRGRRLGWWARLQLALLPEERKAEIDWGLDGWPWHADAAPWVEPTATALLALERLRASVELPGAAARIDEGERLLLGRACPEGGWNYGNGRVLGADLEPYPDTTALALLALRDHPEREEVRAGRRALARLLEDPSASGLALALGALAEVGLGSDPVPWRERLRDRFRATGFRGETRSLALAALALDARPGAPGLA